MTKNKKILIVADLPTHPIDGGNKMCIIQNSELLRNLDYDVYFLLYHRDFIPKHQLEATMNYWGNHFLYFATPSIKRFIWKAKNRLFPRLRGNIDFYTPDSLINFINNLNETYKFTGLLVNYIWLSKLAFCSIQQKAIYTHDVFTYRAQRITSSYKWMSFKPNQEAKALQRFENILAIQNIEASFFSYLAPNSEVITIYSPAKFVSQPILANKNILFFSGAGDLNLLGIRWFINLVYPLIKTENSETKLFIGGGICTLLKDEELPDGVELKGKYEDPSDFYLLGNIVINPVYSGSGLKIKTIEALAHGKWTVTHPHSAEGLFCQHIAPLITTDKPEDFKTAIMQGFIKDNLEIQKNLCQAYINSYNNHIINAYRGIF